MSDLDRKWLAVADAAKTVVTVEIEDVLRTYGDPRDLSKIDWADDELLQAMFESVEFYAEFALKALRRNIRARLEEAYRDNV